MDSPLAELLSVAITAALQEAQYKMATAKAKLSVICELHSVSQDDIGIAKLPETARTMALKLVREYTTWQKASHRAHKIIAAAREDATL
jgi:hypothetical protein